MARARVTPLFVVVSLVSMAAPQLARAECKTAFAANLRDEVVRIKACLASVARLPSDKERKLFAYLHPSKVKDVGELGAATFWPLYAAQQNRADELRISRLEGATVTAEHLAAAKKLAPTVLHLTALKARFESKPADFGADAATQQTVSALVAYEKVYPGFLDRYRNDGDADKAAIDVALRTASGPTKIMLQGYQLAHVVVGPPGSVVRNKSNQSAGNGLYLGADPIAFLNHADGDGVVCTLPATAKVIIDAVPKNQQLIDAGILIPGPDRLYQPSGYNQFVWPEAAEQAFAGYIYRWPSASIVYTAKGGLDLKACKPITLADFAGNCEWYSSLLIQLAGGAQGANAVSLMNRIATDDKRSPNPDTFWKSFFASWAKCAKDAKATTCREAVKDAVLTSASSSPDFAAQISANQLAFNGINTTCGWTAPAKSK